MREDLTKDEADAYSQALMRRALREADTSRRIEFFLLGFFAGIAVARVAAPFLV